MKGFILNSKITVSDKFNVTVGLRAELPNYMNDLTANPSIDALTLLDKNGNPKNYSSGSWPKSRVQLSPRLGFNYDVMGDRTLTLRGGTGIFTGRIPFVWLTNMPTASGVLQNTIEPGSYAEVAGWIGNIRFQPQDIYHYVTNPPAGGGNVFINSPKDGAPASFALVDSDFKMPSVWRSSFGADFKIPNSVFTLTTDILYTKDVNSVFLYGANRKESTERMTYSDRAYYPNAASYQYNDKIGANSATVLTNSDTKGTAFSATIGATMRTWKGLSGSAFYTYSEAKEISANAGSSASSAWQASPTVDSPNQQSLSISNFALPHRVVANVSYNIKNTTIGVYYTGSHQGRFSYYYSNDVNGDGIANDLMYIPNVGETTKFANITSGSGANAVTLFTAAQQEAAFNQFIADNGLEKYRGQILPRNEFLLPWTNRVDIRIAQSLFTDMVQKGDKVQITLDVLNFGNLINSDWGIQDNNVSSYGAAILGRSGALSPNPSFTMLREGTGLVSSPTRPANTRFTTWSAMLGFKYSF